MTMSGNSSKGPILTKPDQPPAKAAGGLDRKKNKKNKKKDKKDLNDPEKIIKDILDKTSFKVPNLSQIVQEKFQKDANWIKCDSTKLLDIRYTSTVDGLSECVSVLPCNFEGRVNLSPSAIMSLTCIKDAPKKRVHYRRGKRVGRKDAENNKKPPDLPTRPLSPEGLSIWRKNIQAGNSDLKETSGVKTKLWSPDKSPSDQLDSLDDNR